jgi:hypothetical protein
MIDFEVLENASAQCFQASLDLTPLILLVLIALDIVLPGFGDLLAIYLAVDSFINLSRCSRPPPPAYLLAD